MTQLTTMPRALPRGQATLGLLVLAESGVLRPALGLAVQTQWGVRVQHGRAWALALAQLPTPASWMHSRGRSNAWVPATP